FARGAARLQPIERYRPAARSDRRALPRRLPRPGPRHLRELRGELLRLLAFDRPGRQSGGDAPELPANLGAGAELRRPSARLPAPPGAAMGADARGDPHGDRAGDEARGGDAPAQPPGPPAVRRAAPADPRVRDKPLERTRRILKTNYPVLEAWLQRFGDTFTWHPPQAGAICLVKYRQAIPGLELVEKVRAEHSVLLVPGDHFGLPNHIR